MATDMKSILEARTRPHRQPLVLIGCLWLVAILLVVRWSSLNQQLDATRITFATLPASDARTRVCPQIEPQMKALFHRFRRLPQSCLSFGQNYPSLGGSGCPCPCANGTSTFVTAFEAPAQEWPPAFVDKLRHVVRIMEGYGSLLSVNVPEGSGAGTGSSSRGGGGGADVAPSLRLSLLHHCCISPADARRVSQVLSSFSWPSPPLRVNFSRLVCAVAGPNAQVSIALLVDWRSRRQLAALAAKLENALAKRGVRASIRQAELQEHHVSVGMVAGGHFPVQLALGKVNTAIPPYSWAPQGVQLAQAVCSECEGVQG